MIPRLTLTLIDVKQADLLSHLILFEIKETTFLAMRSENIRFLTQKNSLDNLDNELPDELCHHVQLTAIRLSGR